MAARTSVLSGSPLFLEDMAGLQGAAGGVEVVPQGGLPKGERWKGGRGGQPGQAVPWNRVKMWAGT